MVHDPPVGRSHQERMGDGFGTGVTGSAIVLVPLRPRTCKSRGADFSNHEDIRRSILHILKANRIQQGKHARYPDIAVLITVIRPTGVPCVGCVSKAVRESSVLRIGWALKDWE